MNNGRIRTIRALMAILLLIGLVRSYIVCVVIGPALAKQAVDRRALGVTLPPSRGMIYDRDGTALLDANPIPAVAVFPSLLRGPGGDLARLSSLLPEHSSVHRTRIAQVYAVSTETYDECCRMALRVMGLIPFSLSGREAVMAANVIGIAGEEGYGVDQIWDEVLQSQSGDMLCVYLNAKGQPIPGLGARIRPADRPAGWVRLTIEKDMQSACELALAGTHGSVVVMNPDTGEIMAMAAGPGAIDRAMLAYPTGSSLSPLVSAARELGVLPEGDRVWSTPLEVASVVAAMITGKGYKPTVVAEIGLPDGTRRLMAAPEQDLDPTATMMLRASFSGVRAVTAGGMDMAVATSMGYVGYSTMSSETGNTAWAVGYLVSKFGRAVMVVLLEESREDAAESLFLDIARSFLQVRLGLWTCTDLS